MDESIKRNNIRYLIDLEVKVESASLPAIHCKVRDYCLSGMFLNSPIKGGAEPTALLARDQPITIEFQGLGQKRQKINAKIVHAVSSGYGVKFAGVSDEALNALLAIATAQQAEKDDGPALAGAWQSEGRSGLRLLLKDTLQRHMVSLFSTFHESLVDAIFERASRPRNTNEQNQMFEALDLLNRRRHDSFVRVSSEIAAGFDACAAGKPLAAPRTPGTPDRKFSSELSLIEDKDFEEWLWASSTVARLESRYEEELFALNQRLSQIQGRPIDHESNPVGAPAICHAFQGLFQSFDVAEPVRELIIALFQELIESHYGPLVNEFNHHLVARGILPEVKRDMHIVRLGLATRSEPVKPATIEPTAAPHGVAAWSAAHHSPAPSTAPASRHPQGDSSGGGRGPASGLAQVRNLLRTRDAAGDEPQRGGEGDNSTRGNSSTGGSGTGGGSGSGSSSGASGGDGDGATRGGQGRWYSTNELSSALSHIESELSTIRANRSKGQSILDKLKESLAKMGGDPHRTIPAAQQESIEVIDNLLESVQTDPVVPEQSRPWFEKLEAPLLKTAIKDETLIENRDHPATHFLNRLDLIGKSLSPQGGERTEAVRAEISTLLEQVKDSAQADAPAFDQALSRLEDLHDSMRQQYESSVAALTRRCEDEYTIETKRDELLALLDEHYGGRLLPAVIFELMDAGWKNLLLRSYVREGGEGRIFRRFLEVIDQTIARLTGDTAIIGDKPWPEQTLVELIPRGLRQVPVADEIIERLMGKLAPQFAMAAVEPASIPLKPMPRITELAEERRRKAREERIARMRVAPEKWHKAEDSVRSMSSGDMITLVDEKGHKQSHKLVWVAGNHSRYVFVDGEGRHSHDLSGDDLTSLLLGEKAAILEGWDVPLMDRATYSMLLSIHNQLLQQTNFDTLTGLQNRRAFELELEKLLERSRIDKTKNILCYLDLDHFSLVNSLCGHGEGDRLLKETADILRDHAPERSQLGRLGGDEFALIMPDMSRTEGLMAVRKLQQAMHAHHFQCKADSYRLAASFGLAELTEMSESGSHLMSAVDNACRIAKESGRDRVEIHHDANDGMTKREGLIKLVGRIRDAMENNLLQLVCQRILPITDDNVGQAPYYEILLRVQDENGKPVSHAEFIQAAEMYNRSIDVDRWVTTTIIDWLEQRLSDGKSLPMVSINLSGRSVNNKEFMDTIVERIIKSTLPRNHLCFEITETAAIGNMGQATHFINRIKRLGCSFSLDDFGTGLSSYSYLKALPVDYIKIDGSFVRNCHNEPRDLAVIKSINEISHAMGKKTIAEFVENEEILKRLHEIGVDYAQGYGIEKPIPITQLD